MPNTSSAKKRLRQNKGLQAQNKSIKSSVKTQIKKVFAAVSEGDIETAETEYRSAQKKLDRAGARNIIHRNVAGRQKARLQKAIKSAKSS